MKDHDKIVSALAILKSSKERIQDINSWCQEQFATDDKGNSCSVHSPEAKKWSALGSIWKSLEETIHFKDTTFVNLWQEEKDFEDLVYQFCSGLLDTKALLLYKTFGIENVQDPGLQAEAINDISPFMKPKEAVHRMILAIYDSAIVHCEEQMEMRAKLFG